MTTPPKDIELRDYFAACALQSLLNGGQFFEAIQKQANELQISSADAIIQAAYQFADAMLAERGKK